MPRQPQTRARTAAPTNEPDRRRLVPTAAELDAQMERTGVRGHALVRHGDEPQWLTDDDIFAIYKIPKGTIRYYRHAGGGPPYRRLSPRVVRYLRSDVEAWLDSKAIRPAGSAS